MTTWACEHCREQITHTAGYQRGCPHYPIREMPPLPPSERPASSLPWPAPKDLAPLSKPTAAPLRQVLKKQGSLL